MKKIYTFLFAILFLSAAQSQIVFQSDFSSWTNNLPDGWVGAKTNFAADSIIKVSTGSQSGTSSVRLVNTTTGHKRFSSQPYSVQQGDTFEIRFWVKGKADIRTGIFDNKLSSGNFGYHYNSYISVNDTNWVMYSQTITADTTWNAAEFLFSIRNTDSTKGHIQIDSAVVMFAVPLPPSLLTITAIQGGGNSSPYVNQTVITKGVVTGYATYKHPTDPNKDYRSYFLQDGDSAWSGIWVSDTLNYDSVAGGDSVLITAQVEEFFNYTRLKNITSFTKLGSGSQPVPVLVSTQEANDEKYEGVLVEVTNAVVIDTSGINFGNFAVNDGSDTLLVDDIMYGPSNGPYMNDILNLKGCMFYSFQKRYLLPRKPSDFTWLISSVAEMTDPSGILIYPNPNNGNFELEFQEQNNITEMQIVNTLGEIIYLSSDFTSNHISLNIPPGIYYLIVNDGTTLTAQKLLVVK